MGLETSAVLAWLICQRVTREVNRNRRPEESRLLFGVAPSDHEMFFVIMDVFYQMSFSVSNENSFHFIPEGSHEKSPAFQCREEGEFDNSPRRDG